MTSVSSIQILSCILAVFHSMKWLAESSDLSKTDGSLHDSLHYLALSIDEELSNLTTTLPEDDGQTRGPQVSYAEDFSKAGLFFNDSIYADMSSNDSYGKKSNSKRDLPEGKWTHENKMQILQLHNLLRGNVTPPAGNMAYMEWDTELEKSAQIWADNCKFEHGFPDEALSYKGTYKGSIGQNLYKGGDPTGYYGIYLWYEEYRYYDLRTQRCLPEKLCGHYVQMAFAESTKLGCAITNCERFYLVVCHYSPSAERDVQIYRVAEPCSQCTGENVLCLNNLCVTQEHCKNNPFDCQDAKCNLKCHNCGRLDKETCTCECTDGWDSRDCTRLCKDQSNRCGKSPGPFPSKRFCPYRNYAAAHIYCRKMCETCHDWMETSNNTCMGTKPCEEGYVHDPSGKSHKCVLLCPGPICNCPSFEIRKNMSIVYSKSDKGDIFAAFSCNNNAKLIGSNTSECQPDGKWSRSLPYCDDCPLFQTRKDMSIVYSENIEGASVATFSCHNNMKLIGSNTSECQPDGKWSFSLPYCEGDEEAVLSLASIGGSADSLRTISNSKTITVGMVILKLIETLLHKYT